MRNSKMFIFFILMITSFSGCQNSSQEIVTAPPKKIVKTKDSIPTLSPEKIKDSIKIFENDLHGKAAIQKLETHSDMTKIDIEHLKTEDLILVCPENFKKELKQDIENTRKEWQDVENPIVVKFMGSDIGDYFHLNFEDAKGRNYDFGFANNIFGEYKLYDNPDTDNPKFLNKKFKLYWSWKISEFPCCSGEYELAKAYIPSITKLKLIEK